MKEEPLRTIQVGNTIFTVPTEVITVDGKLEFTDANNDGNIQITITEDNE